MSAAFDAALERARHVVCGDMEGLFTCHTVDPYVDALEQAHCEEVADLERKLATIREIVVNTPLGRVHPPLSAKGAHLYNGSDYGSLVATVEDVDGAEAASQLAAAVNAVDRIRGLLA